MNIFIILSIIYHGKLFYQLDFTDTPLVQVSVSSYLEGLIVVAVASIIVSNILSIMIIKFRLESDLLWFLANGKEKGLGYYEANEWDDYFLIYFTKGILLMGSLLLLYAISPKII